VFVASTVVAIARGRKTPPLVEEKQKGVLGEYG